MEFIDTIHTLRAGPRDILVSFDVVSLFTMVPTEEALRLLSRHFDEAILRLFRHVLTSSFFSFNGQFYEQTEGVAMGSPLSPAIANYFFHSSLMMEAARTSETSVDNYFTRQYIPEDNSEHGFEMPVSCARHLSDFCGVCSS
jgi:hypothetical protein